MSRDAMEAVRCKSAGVATEARNTVPTISGALHMLDDAARRMEAGECGVGWMLTSNPDLVNRLRASEDIAVPKV
ncbi:hypothetical protein IQ25_03263 [Novosphingobium taihuense]|uniref:Uncharacterized protein n=1 Tax=Novosphingobium taihuense TaxID=260085 RepID=A0A7W7AEK1_9SPHN|nr:hypothetical protein [Novosphingobium taihuense]MBB4615441.1 hypothetical protein [Novosphingobium taihuense]TWH82111.1 hypothetical protein IQ25_03263 [Novosphingobium taihuense]